MKVFIIDTYYPNFLASFYKQYPNVISFPYDKLKMLLIDQAFGTANFYSKNLIKLGHQAQDIIANDENLQKKWAKEHKVKYFGDFIRHIPGLRIYLKPNWSEKILEAQISEFKPDILYCQDLSFPVQSFLSKIKRHVKLIIGQIASGVTFDKKYFRYYDLLLTSFPHYVERFRSIGVKTEYLKIAFEDTILSKIKKAGKQYHTVFVGGFSRHHLKDQKFLTDFEYLAEKTKVDFWGYGIKNLNEGSPIRNNYHGEAWGLDMYNILYNSKIVLNRHIDVAENNANNMRLYESTGVGTMLLTDYKDNLHELFEIGKEVETYKTKEEMVDKVKYYLSHDSQREKIAKAGQKRTLRDHTYKKRMNELTIILNKYL